MRNKTNIECSFVPATEPEIVLTEEQKFLHAMAEVYYIEALEAGFDEADSAQYAGEMMS